ncbi:4-hydroxy-2-oxoglutarate aldolase, mitochondrial [Armadillidium vulgare]|nr:4-hydroxy-2-oxoglutarate aldolase, mitochondrial [Armadillidium vulgare]
MSYANDSTKHKKNNLNFAGIFTAITTPFNSDESIAFDKLESNIQKWNKLPFKGYVIEGCTGEYVYLTTEEKLQVVKKSRELISRDKILIGGSGCESTRETIYVTKKMAELGVDAVMVVTPSYYKSKMTDEALIRHYEQVANNSPVPIVLYNVPIFTRFKKECLKLLSLADIDIGVESVAHLAKHPNIIGIKECGDSVNSEDRSAPRANQKRRFSARSFISRNSATQLFRLGAVGTFCALSNVLGKEICDLYDLCLKGTSAKEEAQALQNSLIAPNTAVQSLSTYGHIKKIIRNLRLYY